MKNLQKLITTDKSLLQELFSALDISIQAKGKKLSQLRFAQPTEKGWIFFKDQYAAWDILDDIVHQTEKKHIHCHRAIIVDALSRLVNLSDQQISTLRMAVL